MGKICNYFKAIFKGINFAESNDSFAHQFGYTPIKTIFDKIKKYWYM